MAGLELVGGWFASPVIKSVLEKAQKYLGANYELKIGTKGMVDELTSTLLLCQATVTLVEKGAIINNPALGDWLRRLKETVYEAEDVLDNTEAKSIKEKVQVKNKVSKFASSSLSAVSNMFSPDDINKSLKNVVDKIKKLSTDIPKILKLVNMNNKYKSQTGEVPDPRETVSKPLEEIGLYGRQDELNLILDIILDSESESSKKGGKNYNNYHGVFVVPIVGMGGVGKTALAQVVYNNPEVQQTFAKRGWISVSNKPDVVLVMRKIIQSLGGNLRLDVITLEDISKNLSSIIGGIKFLIVLDDMFESQWEYIYGALFHCAAPGSVVLITTQNQVFGNRVGTYGPIALSALDPGKFWELFRHFAFGDPCNYKYLAIPLEERLNLKSIGKQIAEKLHGLPLAAKIIGKILRSNMDEDRWRRLSKSEWWNIPEGKSQILPYIGLGYEQLDPCLRQCFAYCSLFPRNSLIEKDRLVHMWIAQNFIRCDANGVMRLEDIGRQWFDELVEKSFLQLAWDNKSYVMHDLMHDLAVIVSSGECLYLEEGVNEIPMGVRHLAVDTNNLELIKEIQNHKNLRSFLYFGFCQVEGMYSAINDMLSTLDSIRVLDLSYMLMEKENKPPTAIWNLQHLRFLDLSSTGITVLTHSSINLYHLQSLYIYKCNFKELPKSINKLINLRHLCADEETIAQISGIGKLTNLQELDVFVVKKEEGHRITELENLREIGGTLSIKSFHNIKIKDEAKLAHLVNKKHLDSIQIIGNHANRNSNDDEVLQELQPNKDIKDLRIDSYAGLCFPNWIIQIGEQFQNLNTLYLISCVYVEVLPPLGELPSLKFLQIENFYSVELIDSKLYGNKQTVFPLLEKLVLNTLPRCGKWTDAGTREFFPRLSKLTIEYNRILRKAPLHLFSSTLNELKIHFCDGLISLGNSESISLDSLNMPFLEDLNLNNCTELKIKGGLQSLTHLKRLILVSCPKIFSTYSTRDQKGKGLQVPWDEGLRSLTHIEADHSLWNHEYHLILGSLPSLQVLHFKRLEFTRFTDNQTLWFNKLTALKEIYFSYCKFEHIPASLTQHSSLKKMEFERCHELKSLSDSIPPNLQELNLWYCSQSLVQLCKAYEGRDQQFISIIPVIHIDDYTQRKEEVSTYSSKNGYMKIQKQKISDAIGQRACNSCRKIFECSDFVLRDWH